MNKVITIAREYGSGGREIGRKLSETLGIRFCDRDLITMAAEKSGLSADALHNVDEKASSSLLYTLAMGSSMIHSAVDVYNMPLNDKLFIMQSHIIEDLAEKESCVFVGRCADYILENRPGVFRVFIYADFNERVKNVAERRGISEADAKSDIVRTDRRRANYYNYYTGKKWGRLENYDLAVSSSLLGVDGTAALIADIFKRWTPSEVKADET